MGIMERPAVHVMPDGGRYFEHEYPEFFLKAYVPFTTIDGQVNNYGFRAPLLLVFEEERRSMEEAVRFAQESGLKDIASAVDSSVLFIYPTCAGGWENASQNLYVSLISEVKNHVVYEDGIASVTDFFTGEFKGCFIRGAIFRADIYSFGKSADYVAKNLLTTVNGEYLWGPGEITPAVCSMERLSVIPDVSRKDIAVISVGNTPEVNAAFEGCEHLLIREKADYKEDFYSFVRRFKMWCGKMEQEPVFEELGMTEEAGSVTVRTSPDNRGRFKDEETHKVGYFAYYNNRLKGAGKIPLVLGFHGGGDSSMYLTFVAGWWDIARRYDFLFVSIENHLDVTASEVIQVLEELKKRYEIDEKRIYATGFSMGSGKTWDLYQEYPEVFAGLMPASALFPIKDNPWGLSLGDPGLNTGTPVPLFYSGGEESNLPELPFQAETCLDRLKYAAGVNDLKARFEDVAFDGRASWEDPVYGKKGDRVEKYYDETRQSTLTVNYYESRDGVIRTAFGSVSGQIHECRQHSVETAWKFISKFSRER